MFDHRNEAQGIKTIINYFIRITLMCLKFYAGSEKVVNNSFKTVFTENRGGN